MDGDPRDERYEAVISAFFEEKIFQDLQYVILWLIIAVATVYLPYLNTSPFRIIFALPVILFIPGYALIAALFPDKSDIDMIERIALSFGLSIAVVPLIGLGLNYTPWGIRLDPIVVSLIIFTVAMVLIAQYRRALLPVSERYELPVQEAIQGIREEFFSSSDSRLDRALSIVLLISIIAAIATTVFVIVVPKEGEKFTEFYILGEKKMAADYPSTLFPGTEYPMYIGIGNHEYRNVSYTVETYIMNMSFDEAMNTSWITDMSLLNKTSLPLPHNETIIFPYNLSTNGSTGNRIEFLLFNESVPDTSVSGMDRINASYRDLHLWVKAYSPLNE